MTSKVFRRDLFHYGRKPKEYRKGWAFAWLYLNNKKPVGDCDDYALTVAVRDAGSWTKFWFGWSTGKYKFRIVDSPAGNETPRHTILKVRGKGYTDSRNLRFSPEIPKEFRSTWYSGLWHLGVPAAVSLGKVYKSMYGNNNVKSKTWVRNWN